MSNSTEVADRAIFADPAKLPLPRPTPETQHFWEGTRNAQLLLQKCNDCTHVYFPPRPFCPDCGCREVTVLAASGKATLFSYVINERPHPAFNGPYSIAVVRLEEGVQMMSNIVNVPQSPEALVLDMPLRVTYTRISEEITLPHFEPVVEADT